ncbi:MAG: TlpA family protein disulfide reductase [Bacteroidetes bacterium]|nr:TlpA family protein disulfide reductase [Bacteroidota bacterium]
MKVVLRHCFILVAITFFACGGNNSSTKNHNEPIVEKTEEINVEPEAPIEIRSVDFNQLAPIFSQQNDTTYVINFWATWCVPCVKELPHFEALNAEYSKQPVKVILVSLDMPDEIDTRLKPFMQAKAIKSEVILLNDPDMNIWIPKVNEDWSGAIPATYIYKKNLNTFIEGSVTHAELLSSFLPIFNS